MKSYETENLIVRKYVAKDYPLWKEAIENRLTSQNAYDVGKVENLTKEYFYDFLTYIGSRQKIDKTYLFAAFLKSNGKHVGIIEFTILLRDGFDWATIGISVHNQFWGQGLGSEMTNIATIIAKDLSIRRLESIVEDGNVRSEKMMLKCGYTFEALRKNFFFDGQKYVDAKCFIKLI